MSDNNQDPVLFQFFTEIGIIEQLARNKLERALPDGMKMSHFSVLNHLARLGGTWSPARLASAFQVTKAAMTNTLQRLETRGLITIKADPADGRGKLVSLSPAGNAMRDKCIDGIGALFAGLETELGQEGFREGLPFLQQVRSCLDNNR